MPRGGGADYQLQLYLTLARDLDTRRARSGIPRGCTIFGAQTEKGLIVGRNYDWIPETHDIFQVYSMAAAGRYAYTAISDMGIYERRQTSRKYWLFETDDAINEKGLFIGLTFAYNPRAGYGLSPVHMVRLVAETCSTVDQAIKVFQKVPLMCAKNFFMADKTGAMAVIEHNSKTFRIVKPQQGVLIQTNHYLAPDLAAEDFVLKNKPANTTYLRYYETLREIRLAGDNFGARHARKILRQTPYVYANQKQDQTIWSLVLEMSQGKYRLIYDSDQGEKTIRLN